MYGYPKQTCISYHDLDMSEVPLGVTESLHMRSFSSGVGRPLSCFGIPQNFFELRLFKTVGNHFSPTHPSRYSSGDGHAIFSSSSLLKHELHTFVLIDLSELRSSFKSFSRW